jgi:uncharacterized membrane protein YjjP (DUF1212 family)
VGTHQPSPSEGAEPSDTAPTDTAPTGTAPTDTELRALLAQLGAQLIACGLPVDEVEDDVRDVAIRLGRTAPQISATPMSIAISLASGEPAAVERVGGPLHLNQVADLTRIRHLLLTGSLSWREAQADLLALRSTPPGLPSWIRDLGWVVIAAGITLLLQPGWMNLLVACVGALLVVGLLWLSRRSPLVAILLPAIAAFVVCCMVLLVAQAGWMDGAVRTVLPPIAILLPGGLLVTGVSELMAGQMVAGSSRLMFGVTQLLMAAIGIVLTAQVVHPAAGLLANIRIDQIGVLAPLLGVVAISVGIVLNESVPFRLLPWVAAVLAATLAAQSLGQVWSGHASLGTFLGAVVATLGSRFATVIRPQLPRLVVFLPSFWVLVPGSLGLLSVGQVTSPDQAAQAGIGVAAAAGAVVTGLIVGSALARTITVGTRRLRAAGAKLTRAT